ncbi:MAG: hypothetical protein EOP81_14900 [Variovorax sp.]|nr:MAG: hypothetical protein EOP81_14900 [Variovorax sp.]
MSLRAHHPWQLMLGLSVWALWFVVAYGSLSVACAVVPPDPSLGARNAVNATLLVLTVLTAALLTFWAWRCARAALHRSDQQGQEGQQGEDNANDRRRFMAGVAAALHACAAVSTLVVGLPLLVMAPCV